MIKITTILFLIVSMTSFAQKDLSLSDAVLEQYRKFYPEQPAFFQWIPEKTEYTFLEGYTTLVKSDIKSKTNENWLTIEEVNKLTTTKFQWFSGFEWLNSNQFLINNGTSYFAINPTTKVVKEVNKIDEKSANAIISSKSLNVAYTIENNVLISIGGEDKTTFETV